MKKLFLISCITLLFSFHVNAQPTLQWAYTIGGSISTRGVSIAVDPSGNVYSTGTFRGTGDFDPGPGTANLTAAGTSSIFVQKLDASGNYVWAKQIKTDIVSDYVYSIAVDASENVYLTGPFSGTMDFDPAEGVLPGQTGPSWAGTAVNDAGVGSIVWNTPSQAQGSVDDDVWAEAPGMGNGDITNYLKATNFGFTLPAGATIDGITVTVEAHSSGGNVQDYRVYLVMGGVVQTGGANRATGATLPISDATSTYGNSTDLWALPLTKADVENAGFGVAIAFDKSGGGPLRTAYVDRISITVDYSDPGAFIANLTSAGGFGKYDIYVSKWDVSGNYVWAKRMGGIQDDYGYSSAVDGSGNVYTTGFFSDVADFDPGPGIANLTASGFSRDIFVQKLDASGNFVWAKRMGAGGNHYGYSIALDGSGNVHTTGRFSNTVDFDPGAGTANLTALSIDVFVQKLDTDGNYIWAKQMVGSGDDPSASGRSIAVDGSGNVYTTGDFEETVDFDPGAGTANLTSVGGDDIFVSKLDASGNYLCAFSLGDPDLDDEEFVSSIALSASGDIFISGHQYSATMDYDPGPGVYNLINTADPKANFIAQYDTDCNFKCAFILQTGNQWEIRFNHQIAVLGSDLHLLNNYEDTDVDYDPCITTDTLFDVGNRAAAVAKYDLSTNCGCILILPVNLLSFTGENQELVNVLEWKTASEMNNDYFTLERSEDGINFEPIGTIQGAGNSSQTLHYQFIDQLETWNPEPATLYYRLKQTDYDGRYEYSNIIAVEMKQHENQLVNSIYPNPAQDYFTFTSASENISVTVINALGQPVLKKEFKNSSSNSENTVQLNGLSKGIYQVLFTQGQLRQIHKLSVVK